MELTQLDFVIENIKREAALHRAEPFWTRYFRSYIDLKASSEFSLLEFIKFDDGAFINKLFLDLLGRPPQAHEFEIYSRKLDGRLEAKLEAMRSILRSAEFASTQRMIKINGLKPMPTAVWSVFNRIHSKKLFFLTIVTYLRGFLNWGDFKYLFRQFRDGKVDREELSYLLAFVYQFTFQSKSKRVLAFGIKKAFRTLIHLLPNVWLFKNTANQDFLLNLIVQQEISQDGALLALHKELTKEIRHQVDQSLISRKHAFEPRLMAPSIETQSQSMPSYKDPSALRSEIDKKYFEFEERFRGSEDLVLKRLETYVPLIEPILSEPTAGPALDIGFGRGEWLKLLTTKGWEVRGVDSNADLVHRTQERGYDVICADAIEYLESCGAESFSLITAFHVVEHIPMEGIHLLIQAAFKALKPGGMLIFETPNPENILVGSYEFWMDPTHIRPIPAPVLSFFVESYGFKNVQVVKKNPYTLLDPTGIENPSLANIVFRFNLERDYAVVARK